MNIIDLLGFIAFIPGLLGIGIYFKKENKGANDYLFAGRDLGSINIVLSIILMDVGAVFSISHSGSPLLLRMLLPVGLMIITIPAYYSAINSIDDSCLIATSGKVTSDILRKIFKSNHEEDKLSSTSRIPTSALGSITLLLTSFMNSVLNFMLYSSYVVPKVILLSRQYKEIKLQTA